MAEIRVRRDDEGRIISRCGECPRPYPDMEFKAEDQDSEIWQCPVCGFTATHRKPPPPLQVIVVDEFVRPN
jgi:rubrerythrin